MALFIFYAKLKLVGASGRIDVFYEGLVTPVTGFLLIDAAIEQQWDVFHNALGHIILLKQRSSAIIPSPISAVCREASCWSN